MTETNCPIVFSMKMFFSLNRCHFATSQHTCTNQSNPNIKLQSIIFTKFYPWDATSVSEVHFWQNSFLVAIITQSVGCSESEKKTFEDFLKHLIKRQEYSNQQKFSDFREKNRIERCEKIMCVGGVSGFSTLKNEEIHNKNFNLLNPSDSAAWLTSQLAGFYEVITS